MPFEPKSYIRPKACETDGRSIGSVNTVRKTFLILISVLLKQSAAVSESKTLTDVAITDEKIEFLSALIKEIDVNVSFISAFFMFESIIHKGIIKNTT